MTPTEQIKKRMHDLTSQDLTQRTYFEEKFREYKEYLEQIQNPKPLKPSSVKTSLRTVASFFSRNGLPLFLKRGDWESTQQQPVIQRMKLSIDDVKAMPNDDADLKGYDYALLECILSGSSDAPDSSLPHSLGGLTSNRHLRQRMTPP